MHYGKRSFLFSSYFTAVGIQLILHTATFRSGVLTPKHLILHGLHPRSTIKSLSMAATLGMLLFFSILTLPILIIYQMGVQFKGLFRPKIHERTSKNLQLLGMFWSATFWDFKISILWKTISVWYTAHQHVGDKLALSQFSHIWCNNCFVPERADGGFKMWFNKDVEKISDLQCSTQFDVISAHISCVKDMVFKCNFITLNIFTLNTHIWNTYLLFH